MENQKEDEFLTQYLTYNSITFPVKVDYVTYSEIVNDANMRERYAHQVYEQFYGNVGQGSSTCAPPDSVSKAPLQSRQDDNKEFKWTDKLIRCLLQSRLGKEMEFIRPKCKKIKLWRHVAEDINKAAGIILSPLTCDIKYRNLLATYRKNKQKKNSTGESPINWEYFDIMDEVLGTKASSCLPKDNIGDSMEENDSAETNISQEQGKENSIVEEELITKTRGEEKTSEKTEKRKKTGISFQAYLFQKLKREEIKEKDQKIKEEEKQKKDQERWEEKKKLKEREIDAILTLAKAIGEKK